MHTYIAGYIFFRTYIYIYTYRVQGVGLRGAKKVRKGREACDNAEHLQQRQGMAGQSLNPKPYILNKFRSLSLKAQQRASNCRQLQLLRDMRRVGEGFRYCRGLSNYQDCFLGSFLYL